MHQPLSSPAAPGSQISKLKAAFIVFLILLSSGCTPSQESISEKDAIKTVEGFFEALDVANTDPDLIDRYVTSDFIIYEAGKKMNKEEFLDLVEGSPLLKTDWQLSDFRVSTDHNSAHVSLFNDGSFIMEQDSVRMNLKLQWLESAYLIKEEGRPKIRFYFSDNIGNTSVVID